MSAVTEVEESHHQKVVTWKFKKQWHDRRVVYSQFFTLPAPHSANQIRIRAGQQHAAGESVTLEGNRGATIPQAVDVKLAFVKGGSEYALSAKLNSTVFGNLATFRINEWGDNLNEQVYHDYDLTYVVKCTMTIKEPVQEKTLEAKTTPANLSEAFAKLFKDGTFSDTVIKVQGKTIKVSKAILAARSPVFHAMFESKLSESRTGEVPIADVSYETLMVLIGFIYSDKVEDSRKLSLDVLVAADKYNVQGLMALCENHLVKNLTKANIEEALIIGKQHNLTSFVARCTQFAANNNLGIELMTKLLNRCF